MRSLLIATVASLALASGSYAAPNCKAGVSIPCGNSCIAKGKECHIKATHPDCKKGKLCGNSCIKATDICHKP